MNKNINSKHWSLVNFCEFDSYAEKAYCALHGVTPEDNLGDITKVDETALDEATFYCGGSPCFVAETKIKTKTGYTPIFKIELGDFVLTHNYKYKPVTAIGKTSEKEIWIVELIDGTVLECTEDHPFLASKIEFGENGFKRYQQPTKVRLNEICDSADKYALCKPHANNKDYLYVDIYEIKNSGEKRTVYNITVEDDHTYLANDVFAFNCQDFSISGKQKGSVWTCKECGHEYNPLTVHFSKRDCCPNCGCENLDKSRSSLLVEYLRMIRHNKPKFFMYENVKNIVGKKFKTTFDMFIQELNEYGYNTHYKVLNSKDFGVPQNRERVYLIGILKELDNGLFEFPEGFDNGIRLKDILEPEVLDKYYVTNEKAMKLIESLILNGKLVPPPTFKKAEFNAEN